ncbi:MAG: diguanylate cyclase [Desulfuromonadaceae bacterium]|nr:diguanylate cyclase [Desulfuromonadaceae bacterium]
MPVATKQLLSLLQQNFGIWVYSIPQAQLDYSTEWLSHITGNQENEIRSPRALLRLIHPFDRSKLLKKLRQLHSGTVARIECELRLSRVDEPMHRIEIHAVVAQRDPHGIVTAITGTATSIQARTLQEESLYDLCQKLQSSETRYRALLQDAKSPIVVMNSDTNEIVDVNNAASSVTGYAKDELLGMRMNELVKAPDIARRSPCGDRETKKDLFLQCKSGIKISVDVNCSNVSVQDRNLTQCIIHDVSLRKRTEDTLRFMASHDPLTGLANRNLLAVRLEKALLNAHTHGKVVAVCFADLNKFKQVNDVYGHDVGDTILKSFAARLLGAIRKNDTAARLGGDEFIFVLENLATAEEVAGVMKHIIQRLNIPYGIQGENIEVNCSIGVSVYPAHGSKPLDLLHLADKAMYHAKGNALDFYLWQEEESKNEEAAKEARR